jgi:hypothetical protein
MIALKGMHYNVHMFNPEVPLILRRCVPPKRLTFTKLYGVTRQKSVLFMGMVLRAPKPIVNFVGGEDVVLSNLTKDKTGTVVIRGSFFFSFYGREVHSCFVVGGAS